ncbi:unnamed protein product [Anisakis simplex]|uniref:Saposin B-type domain-containing protein n=1 Tax=Anisakis simplex TaxID=6269 RepID=A0A0M3K629_ANISI|nr:unnamed protein product [Anisakis simplex]
MRRSLFMGICVALCIDAKIDHWAVQNSQEMLKWKNARPLPVDLFCRLCEDFFTNLLRAARRNQESSLQSLERTCELLSNNDPFLYPTCLDFTTMEIESLLGEFENDFTPIDICYSLEVC